MIEIILTNHYTDENNNEIVVNTANTNPIVFDLPESITIPTNATITIKNFTISPANNDNEILLSIKEFTNRTLIGSGNPKVINGFLTLLNHLEHDNNNFGEKTIHLNNTEEIITNKLTMFIKNLNLDLVSMNSTTPNFYNLNNILWLSSDTKYYMFRIFNSATPNVYYLYRWDTLNDYNNDPNGGTFISGKTMTMTSLKEGVWSSSPPQTLELIDDPASPNFNKILWSPYGTVYTNQNSTLPPFDVLPAQFSFNLIIN